MGITARSIGGAGLMGLGDALQAYAQQGIRRRGIADQWNFELLKQAIADQNKDQDRLAAAQIKREDARTAALQGHVNNVLLHPETAAAYIQAAKLDPAMQGVSPDQLQNMADLADTVGSRQILQSVNTAPTEAAMGADLGQRLTAATGKDYGSLPLQPQFDLARFGGEQPDLAGGPTLQAALATALARKAQLDQAQQAKITEAGQMKQAEARGTGLGTGAAKHELHPQDVADAIDTINQEAGPKAAAAGQSAYAQGAGQFDATHTPARIAVNVSEAGQKAGAEARARAAGEAPYKTPTILVDNQGNAVPVAFGPGPTGTQVASVVPGMPADLSKTRPKEPQKLTAPQINDKAIMNTAELQGVQVLKMLHDAGLDKDNTPWSPRYTNFIAQTFKIAPEDFQRADLNQRTAMLQGTILRGMAGARPSKEWMEMLAAHLPNPVMSGQQLAHVLNNVLQQQQQKRDDMAFSTGHTRDWMGPQTSRPGEMTYDQWLDAVKQERAGGARAGTAPPGLQTAPAGTSAPNPGDELIKKILQQPPR